jgi:glycosyltransferase involved in cell wall biosynthesis
MIDITAILNVHNEGLLAGPSIISFEAAIAHAQAQQLSVESIVVLDRPDETTLSVFENLGTRHKLIVSDAGDPALARNTGVAAAKGEYLTLLDGDDLYGYRWLAAAHDFCARSSIALIAHTEVSLGFGDENFIWWNIDSEDPIFDFDYLRFGNYWPMPLFGRRDIFVEFPFQKNDLDAAYCHEDWFWICQTFQSGIAHRPVPDTVSMYRRRKGSQRWRCFHSDVTVFPTELTHYSWKPTPKRLRKDAKNIYQ